MKTMRTSWFDSCIVVYAYLFGPRIDFEDTYDGLGDQLEEANDDFNDDTFGGGDGRAAAAAPQGVGKDFDFFGQTAKVSGAINEEQMRFSRQQLAAQRQSPPRQVSRPYKTGYEAYKKPDHASDLKVNASLWGTAPQASTSVASQGIVQRGGPRVASVNQPTPTAAPAKKMMSLEEVEAAMRSQAKKPSPSPVPQQQVQMPQSGQAQQSQPQPQQGFQQRSTSVLHPQPQASSQQRIQHQQRSSHGSRAEMRMQASQPSVAPQALQPGQPVPQSVLDRAVSQPRQILQNPNRQPAQLAPRPPEPIMPMQPQPRVPISGPSGATHTIPIITHPQQLMQLSEEERQAFLVEDAKRAKRNHKIYLLSKDNGLMTPQDKNFITRIQLQQLMTATGSTNENDPDASMSEDFYYQVHNQIRGGMRESLSSH